MARAAALRIDRPIILPPGSQSGGPQSVSRIPAVEAGCLEDLRLALEDLSLSDAHIELSIRGARHTVASGVLTRSDAAIAVALCYHVFCLTRLCTALQPISLLDSWQTALVRSMWDRYPHFALPFLHS